MSESQCSCIFQELLNRGEYAYTGLFVRYGLRKSSYVSKIPPVQAKNQIITVSVFLSTLQLTALLLKSLRLRLHCYTLTTSAIAVVHICTELLQLSAQSLRPFPFKVGLGISRTNADSQWNPVYNAFHRNFCCGNETIRR